VLMFILALVYVRALDPERRRRKATAP